VQGVDYGAVGVEQIKDVECHVIADVGGALKLNLGVHVHRRAIPVAAGDGGIGGRGGRRAGGENGAQHRGQKVG